MSSPRNPGSQSSLREANRARIVDAITHHGALTQVELAAVTGLSPATVSNIVKEQAAAGVLATTPTSRSGRRAVRVTLAREMGLVVGLHVSNRQLRVALADAGHQVLVERMLPLARDHRADSELDRVVLLIQDMAESVGTGLDEVLAVGVGLAAPIDPGTGLIATRGLMRGWDGVPVADELETRLRRPVFVDNEANLGALGEYRMGAAQGVRQAAYLRVSHGVGAGLIIDGRVYRGGSGKAGEIGHLTLDEQGQVCRCGNRGCLETLVGAAALAAKFPGSHTQVKLRDIVLRANAGDAAARRVIADAGRHLGVALAGLSNLVDPHRIVVGGELAEADEMLLSPLRHALERSTLATASGVPDVVKGELGERAEVLGAVLYAIDLAHITAGRPSDAARTTGPYPMGIAGPRISGIVPDLAPENAPDRGGLAS
ncbi:ROK family transcriptional regulator [Cryobacterium sp. 1639]|uniref:ROK family transcriptional regulator n=1 Tax=Cryobacterium inferilacus TaxID=2866629 RepID=UPI001C73B1CA|nr:ROK family transcriptional regulator [Cryobacterium sp. 1639]MBX0299032.1 ROK family transcriptional regulator [Cryobacterium sp. 1639]